MTDGTLRFRCFIALWAGCQILSAGCTSEDRSADSSHPLLQEVTYLNAPQLEPVSPPQVSERPTLRSVLVDESAAETETASDIPRGPLLTTAHQPVAQTDPPTDVGRPPMSAGGSAQTTDESIASSPYSVTPYSAQPDWQGFEPQSALPTPDNEPAYGPTLAESLPPQRPTVMSKDVPAQPAISAAKGRAPRPVSDAVQAVARQAEREIQTGFALANRGATFSAHNHFLRGLRMISEALDAERGEKYHSRALERGLVALKEAEDFVLGSSQQAEAIDVGRFVSAHRTQILKAEPAGRTTCILALQRYFTYSQEQLAIAGGNVPAASSALHYLGKLYAVQDGTAEHSDELNTPKSMVFHQAALMVDSSNYLAANELGVLLARIDQMEDAKRVFIAGLRTRPQATAWRNLAVVHERLGERELAQLARQELKLLQQQPQPPSGNVDPIIWLSNEQFARTNTEAPQTPPKQLQTQPAKGRDGTAQKPGWFGSRR